MNKMRIVLRQYLNVRIITAVLLLLALVGVNLGRAYSADYPKLENRSLLLSTTAPSGTANYTFSWRWPANASVGSIRFLLCEDPYTQDPCSATPPGDLSGATLTSQSGALGGFSISSQTADEMIIARGSAGGTGTGQYTFSFDNVTNPSTVETRFYVQIFTYSTIDATGTANHESSVASAITTPIMINAEVPPILYFCAGLTVTEWCDNVSGNFIDYGDLDPVNGHWASSQFGAATNALGGYVVTINGDTMTSGNKLIEPLSTPAGFTTGVEQFGLNLRANINPALGADVIGAGIGVVDPDYNNPDQFLYIDGDVVATSATGSLFNTYTVTYIVNIPPDQPSGIYNTTIAYICTAAF